MPVTWSKDLVSTLRTAWANGASHKECGKLTGATPKAIEVKVRELKIQRANGRPVGLPPAAAEPSIPYFVHHQAVTDYRTWDQQRHCYINNHLYREPVSLAAVW